ncbi:MAG: hypothetical protein WD598_11540 [Acidimicrobiia bacterium]
MFRIIKRAPWIALGGAVVWFFDPERGPQRRAELKSWLESTASEAADDVAAATSRAA